MPVLVLDTTPPRLSFGEPRLRGAVLELPVSASERSWLELGPVRAWIPAGESLIREAVDPTFVGGIWRGQARDEVRNPVSLELSIALRHSVAKAKLALSVLHRAWLRVRVS
jgi:hypothetical protein